MSSYEHNDTNRAMYKALKLISALVSDNDGNDFAMEEAAETLLALDSRATDSAWLTDRLYQASIDLEIHLRFLRTRALQTKGEEPGFPSETSQLLWKVRSFT